MIAPAPTSLRVLPDAGLVPAVAYVRTSGDQPLCSIEHQLDCLRAYAARRGLEIIRVFADEGPSRLSLRGRASLRQLIAAVTAGPTRFKCILVYDASRWGRFQDAGESRYYEYLCARAGIAVHYWVQTTAA